MGSGGEGRVRGYYCFEGKKLIPDFGIYLEKLLE